MLQSTKASERPATAETPGKPLLSPPPSGKSPINLFGLPIAPLTLSQTVTLCESAIRERRRLLIGVLNAAKIVHLQDDPALKESLLDCDLLLADGQAVVWATRVLGDALPERVAGIDLFYELLERASLQGFRVYLLGARQDVLSRVQEAIRLRWPGVVIAGSRHGYFDVNDEAEIAEDIRRATPDMLFLGMSSPKKENFLARFGPTLGVPVIHGVGGSFDVLAGVTRRAPTPLQRHGLEWAYRLAQEPRRLGPRYYSTNKAFVRMVFQELTDRKNRVN